VLLALPGSSFLNINPYSPKGGDFMNAVSRCCAVVSLLLLTTPSYALEPFATYDNFTTALLNPLRWYGGEFTSRGEEALRMVESGKLHMAYRAYGNKGTNSGTRVATLLLFLLRKVAAITAMKATVRVLSPFTATGCTANPATTSSRIGLQGSFFNTDTPMPGLFANDVRAGIGVFASPSEPGVLRVQSFVYECHDTSCSSFTIIGGNDLGTVSVNTDVMLQMQWDPPNNRFLFQRDSQAAVSVSYGSLADTAKPGVGFKTLEVVHFPENCVANPRPQGFLNGTFDDVQVNQSAS
jgi:hypothetical protein